MNNIIITITSPAAIPDVEEFEDALLELLWAWALEGSITNEFTGNTCTVAGWKEDQEEKGKEL